MSTIPGPGARTAANTASEEEIAASLDDGDTGSKPSAATVLVRLAMDAYRVGITTDDEPYAIELGERHVVRSLRGSKTGLRAELARRYFRETGKAAPQQALADALAVIDGLAREAEPRDAHLRVAALDGVVYVDTGDVAERAVKITPGGWTVVDSGVPVLFKRTRLTGPMPTPQMGGSMSRLWSLVNLDVEDRPLVLAWMVAALIAPSIPHPILSLFAEQGSGKSSASRMLCALVDPSPVQLRKPPRDAEGWVTAASGSWCVGIDNLSTIPDWLSDSLCRAVTGDGDVRRALYTDGELSVFAFRRVILVNGIDVGAMRGDYAERSLVANLRPIDKQNRRTEREIGNAWERDQGLILGALLDLACAVLKRLPSVALESSPRMADFARILAAVDEELGTDGFSRYMHQSQTLASDTLESDPFLNMMMTVVRSRFTGTSTELLQYIEPDAPGWKPPRGWPSNSRAVTSLLRRNAPALRSNGWTITDDEGRNISNAVRWTIEAPVIGETACNLPSSPSSNSYYQVSGIKRDESGHEVDESDESSNSYTRNPESRNSSDSPRLTSGNEATSQTRTECTPSLQWDAPDCCPDHPATKLNRFTRKCAICIATEKNAATA